jgi:hypothetical protein
MLLISMMLLVPRLYFYRALTFIIFVYIGLSWSYNFSVYERRKYFVFNCFPQMVESLVTLQIYFWFSCVFTLITLKRFDCFMNCHVTLEFCWCWKLFAAFWASENFVVSFLMIAEVVWRFWFVKTKITFEDFWIADVIFFHVREQFCLKRKSFRTQITFKWFSFDVIKFVIVQMYLMSEFLAAFFKLKIFIMGGFHIEKNSQLATFKLP